MTRIQQLFLKNLRRYRLKRDLSQAALAELCGVSPNYIGELEQGRKFPSADTFDALINALKIRPYELFLDESDVLQYADPELIGRFAEFLNAKLSDVVTEAQNAFRKEQD